MPSRTDELRDRIADRLAAELGDRQLAVTVAERLDLRAVEAIAESGSDPATTELLSFEPIVHDSPESLVVFAFGNRGSAEDELLPGRVNLELASIADDWAHATGLPVFAQWEVADQMRSASTRVGAVTLDDGSVEYLSTAGVAQQVRDLVWPIQTHAGRVAVLAMADHAVRCCRTLERFGLSAGVPANVELPSTYDPLSGQPWTRDRASYIAVDILARCLA